MKQILLLAIIPILISCKSGAESSQPAESKSQSETKLNISNKQKLETEASQLRAGGFVKSFELHGSKAIIEYVKDYREYKDLNPQSTLSERELNSYWSTDKAVKKALIDGSVRLMKKLDFINETKIILPYQGQTYIINVSKPELEKFVGSSFKSIEENWANRFSDEFVYSDEGRDRFFTKFGIIE